jgi:RimJ/RimL family protein N-acetyltransferase
MPVGIQRDFGHNRRMTEQIHAPPDARIAPIAPGHIESFHRALDTVARERKYLAHLEAPPLSRTRAFVLSNIKSGNPQFVALAGGEVVGWCEIGRDGLPTHAHRGTLGLGILPAYRGRGLGTRLLNAALEAAFAAGFVRIELDVYAGNARAIALYEKAGFVKEGLIRAAAFIDGDYRDAITMALVHQAKVSHQ